MAKYEVTIRATVTKTETVEANSYEEATALAHEQFSVLNTDNEEHYEEDTMSIIKQNATEEAYATSDWHGEEL
jgi:hypothetical protein